MGDPFRNLRRQPSRRDGEAEVRDLLVDLGVVIPKPATIVLALGDPDTGEAPPVYDPEVHTDEWVDAHGGVIIDPEHHTVADLAGIVTGMVTEASRTYPARWSWRRWPIVPRALSRLYWLGVLPSGGGSSWDGADPVGGAVTLLPYRWVRGRRSYVLGLPRWWWQCIGRQLRHGHRITHRPAHPWAMGVCARCVPCPTCGAAYDCAPTCAEVTG